MSDASGLTEDFQDSWWTNYEDLIGAHLSHFVSYQHIIILLGKHDKKDYSRSFLLKTASQ